jgi:hypothetical protein
MSSSVLAVRTFRFKRLAPLVAYLAVACASATIAPLAGAQTAGFPGSTMIAGDDFMTASLLQDALPAPMQPGTNPELPATDVTGRPAGLPEQPYFDMDEYLDSYPQYSPGGDFWGWTLLPDGLIYKSYLAGAKESRISAHIINEKNHSTLWDATLGGRIGILRLGNADPINPQGFQIDVEGSAQLRLDIKNEVDVQAVDFRGGVPLTWGYGPHRYKFAYYHLSAHLGDEFLLDNPTYPRLNFARDCLVLGYSYYWTERLRLYAETAWAFYIDVSEPWEFQFGVDWAPTQPTGIYGAPFAAVNGHIRQELDFGGNLTFQTGWAWVGDNNSHLLRMGLQYYNGHSSQFSMYQVHEQQIGFGLWYDY